MSDICPTLPELPIRRAISSVQIARLMRDIRELQSFLYSSTQDSRVVEIALEIVQNPVFIDLESRAVAQSLRNSLNSPAVVAGRRYDAQVAPAIVDAMSGFAGILGMAYMEREAPRAKPLDSIVAVRAQINTVNYCPAQVRGIIERGRVKDAYVNGVAARADSLVK